MILYVRELCNQQLMCLLAVTLIIYLLRASQMIISFRRGYADKLSACSTYLALHDSTVHGSSMAFFTPFASIRYNSSLLHMMKEMYNPVHSSRKWVLIILE